MPGPRHPRRLIALLFAAGFIPAAIALACEKVTENGLLGLHDATRAAALGTSTDVHGEIGVAGAPRHLETGAVQAYQIDAAGQWRPQTLLAPAGAAPGAAIGSSLAFDGSVLFAGAPGDNTLAAEAGSVYVFQYGTRTGWSAGTQLLPDAVPPFARFGEDLDASGDVAVVAAPGAGAAFVFRRIAGVWTQETMLTSSTAGPGDAPAVCVAVSGDAVLVGDPLGDASSTDGGEVLVYRSTPPGGVAAGGAPWGLDSILTAADSERLARFGAAVSLHGEVAVIGAPGANETGTVYVFRFDADNGTWGEEAILQAPGLKRGDQFGAAVDVAEDAVIVGAPHAANSGRMYLFRRLEGSWVLQQTMTPARARRNARIGASVSTDGYRILAGAPGAYETGAVYTLTMPLLGDCDANGLPDNCDIARGTMPDGDEDGVGDNCGLLTCADADINGDGLVDFEDMLRVILDWDTDGTDNDGDIDDDGIVGINDLNTVLAFWGECPGICCLPLNIGCVELTVTDCEAMGGTFAGTTFECGTELNCPVDPSPPGACCLLEGGCLQLPPELCDIIDGEFQGEGVDCGVVLCD